MSEPIEPTPEQEIAFLHDKITNLQTIINKCCHFDATGKPVPHNAALYLYPNDDTTRLPMIFHAPPQNTYCWFLNLSDAKQYADARRLQERMRDDNP